MNHRRLLTVLFGVALSAYTLYSQANQGAISGTITDSSGAIVPNAKVLVVNKRTGIRFETLSNSTGVYRVPAMEAGSYQIEVTKEGFQQVVIPDVTLQVTQLLSVDVVVPVGSTQTKIEVKAPTEILQTESAGLGNTLSTNTVESLPLNGRNFLQLAALTPGVNASLGASSFSRGNKIQVMAGQLSNTAILMDGADINTDFDEGSVLMVNVDAIADYKVVTNAFSAEYGFGNSAVNITTKSGTNSFHGSLFEFLRNSKMDSRNPFAITKAPLRQNQFGVTFGGPIVKNNTFFFVDWQSLRSRIGTTINTVVPTLAQRDGNFSAQTAPITDPSLGLPCTAADRRGCFVGNIIPTNRLNPVAKFFLPYILKPNFGVDRFVGSGANTFDGNTFDVRVDQHINKWLLKNDRIFARYSYDKRDANNPGNNPGVTDQPLEVKSQNAVLGWTHMLGASMVFDLRGSYYREPILQNLAGNGENLTQKAGIRGFELTSTVYPGFPTMTIGGGVMGIDVSGSKPVKVMASHSDLDTSMIWIHGAHSFKMGFHFRNTYGGNTAGATSRGVFSFTGIYTGNGIGDFLLGIPQNGSRGQPQSIVDGRQHFYHGYFQDNWKITRRLTLDLGMRFEVNNPAFYPRNQSSTFDPKTGKIVVGSTSDGKLDLAVQPSAPLAGDLYSDLIVTTASVGLPSNFMPGTYWMAAPRVGVAWRPIGEKTVFRAGYGIFSVPPELGWFKAAAAQNVPFSLSETVNNTALTEVQNFFPSGLTLTKATRPFPRISALSPDYHIPYQQQWNVAIQRAFGQNWSMEVAYVGAEATHLPAPYRINDPGPGAQATIQQRRPYPLYGSISLIGMGGTSSYNSLQVNASKKLSHGLSYTASYSFTKAIHLFAAPQATGFLSGVEQIPGRYDLERAVAFYQPPQAFIGSYIYELPFGEGKGVGGHTNKVLSKLISGWQTTGIISMSAGTPFTPTISADLSGTGSPSPRPNYVGGSPLYPDNKTAAKWFNPAAFQPPTAGTFGNVGLNILRGPSLKNIDVGLMKNTTVGEGRYLQFRAEAFNFTNTTHLGQPTANIQSPAAGQILSAQNPRQLQMGLKFIF